MEGLLDAALRDTLTRVGGVDRCVSEFIRVTHTVLPLRAFTRVVPELLNGGKTAAGVWVRPQLLGSAPNCLADNAAQLASLNPPGIDLNFGCPAKTVNQSRGGAVLLDEPELVGRIVSAVRRAVPAHIAVSAKMRLGYKDDRVAEACAHAIAQGGANELVIHARTQAQGYKPPVYWDRIAEVKASLGAHPMRVVANGDVGSVEAARRCCEVTGCDTVMIGRGMIVHPGLALRIKAQGDCSWASLQPLMAHFWTRVCARVERRHRAGRLKQWLNHLRHHYPEAQQAFDDLRERNDPEHMQAWIDQHTHTPPSVTQTC
ncbi:MAG: tRNA-dihydrouridine synthase [Pseudomonadota bacterium]|jgi:tRNA-dihydrouridine synthase C